MAQHLNKIDLKKFPAASSSALEFSASTDSASAPRLKIEAGGKLTWGGGTVVGDTNLYRSAADTLKTDDYLIAQGGLTVESYQVTTAGASSGTVLKFDGTKFAPGIASTVGNLDDLADVVISSPTTNQALIYNGTQWVNGSAGAAGSTYVATIGNGASTTFVVSHGLNTRDVFVQVRNANSPYEVIDVQWEATSTSTVTFNFSTPPSNNGVRVAIYSATTGTNIALPLDGLTDVVITSPSQYQILNYDGTNWVNTEASVTTYVRNAESTTLQPGEVVYLFGQQGDRASVKRASNNGDITSATTLGVVASAIPTASDGPVVTQGYLSGLNLAGYTPGGIMYLGSTAGTMTQTKPYAPNHLVYVGVCVRANAGSGIMYVRAQNGYELDEIHNVDNTTTPPVSGDILKYNGSLWVNGKAVLGTNTTGNYVASVSAGTGVTVSGASGEGWTPTISIGQSVGTSDSPSFAGITVGGSVPAIYATMGSNKVGIGTNTPSASAQLTVKSTSTAFSPLVLQNASGQTASSQEWQNAMGSVLAYVSSTGDIFSYSTVTGASVSGWAIAQGGELASDTNLTLLYGTGGGSSPTQNASINVKRGISPTVAIRWNETTDKWQFTNDGTTYKDLGSGGITVSDTAPASPATGDLWYESDTGSTYVYYDSYWIEIGGSTAYDQIIGTIQAKGDLLAGTASQAIARLAVGTNGTRLVADSTTATGLAWASDTVNTVIDAKGDLLVGLADNTVGKLTVGTNGQMLTADSTQTNGLSWVTAVTGAGHSNIYATGRSTSVTIVSATRTYGGRQYLFTNLTFNMPSNANTDTSDWTAPANSSTYKWSYIYIRPSDNKFFLSNTAPAAGLNYRTIGGSVCLYLFPAYTSTIDLYSFNLSDNLYRIDDFSAWSGYNFYTNGITLMFSYNSLSYTSSNTDITALFPTTATSLTTGVRWTRNGRLDAGGFSGYEVAVSVQDRASTWRDLYYVSGFQYLKTPTTGGAYFPAMRSEPIELVTSTKNLNFAVSRISWTYADGVADAYSGMAWWLRGFNDGNIF